MSTATRGVANPDAFSAAVATPTAPIPDWPRARLTPRIAPAWWWGNPPGSQFPVTPTGTALAPSITPEIPPAGPDAGGDCGCC